jgi:cell division protein FtsW (lipid II flippase)
MVELAAWLASLPIGQALRRLNWLVPWLQIIHILANGIVLSAVVMIDMRIWGISRSQASIAMARRFQPWIWAGLVVLTASGIVLILYAPRRVLTDITFQVKMELMGLAIAATLALLLMLRPGREARQDDPGPHVLASLLGTLTLLLWVGVTLAGRGRWLALLLR